MTASGWRTAPVSEMLRRVSTGVSVNSESRPRATGEVGVLKTSAVTYGIFRSEENKAVIKDDLHRAREHPKAGCVLLSRMNTPALVGASAYVARDWPDLVLPDRIWQLEPMPQSSDGRWLFYVLSAPATRARLGELASGTSGSMKNLSQEKFLSLRLHTPPLGEQRKIAAILSSVDDAIEATQAVIDQLLVVKEAMMAELLTRGLPGRHTRFKQTEIGEVPENWEVLAVDTLIEPATTITYGIVQAGPHVADGVPYIRTGDVKPSGIVEIDRLGRTAREIAAKFERSKVRTGDLVICIRASVGAVASVPPALDGANLTQGTARISPGPRINGTYLLWALRSQGVQDWIDLQCKGSTFREITLGRLRQTPIPVPDRGEQQAIAGSLDTVEGRFRTEEHAQEGLRALKSALMSVLLTGELRVTPDKAAA